MPFAEQNTNIHLHGLEVSNCKNLVEVRQVWKPVGTRCAIELSDVHHVILVLQNCGFVVVHVEIVRCAEYGHETRDTRRPSLPVHPVTGILGSGARMTDKRLFFSRKTHAAEYEKK